MHFDYLTPAFRKFNALFLGIFVVFFIPFAGLQKQVHFDADHSADKTNYPYVMVHGFQSWNEDEPNGAYKGMPYWGLFNGDCLKGYREAGYKCVAPMVDPMGSDWHRTCEMYAKLVGARVDYGKAHSEACNHERYGEDYTGKALLDKWDSKHKVNLMGHSQAGKDVILLCSLLSKGSAAEQKATKDGSISGLFTGGKADWVHACVGLAAVYNGTTLFMNQQAVHDTATYLKDQVNSIKLAPRSTRKLINRVIDGTFLVAETVTSGDVADPDTAIYDMHPDNAVAMNKEIETVKNVYYFSLVQDDTKVAEDGHIVTDNSVADPIIGGMTPIIARTNTVTPGGLVLDEKWQPNDGCANVISQIAPLGEPVNNLTDGPCAATAKQAKPGIYNVLPTVRASHMWPIGDFVKPQLEGPTYVMHIMEMINAI